MQKFILLCTSVASVNAQGYARWNPIDIQSLACPVADAASAADAASYGEAVILINTTETNPNQRIPHIVTFFRTFDKAAVISYKAVDANGKVVISGKAAVTHAKSGALITDAKQTTLAEIPATPVCPPDSGMGKTCTGATGGRRLETAAKEDTRGLLSKRSDGSKEELDLDDLLEPETNDNQDESEEHESGRSLNGDEHEDAGGSRRRRGGGSSSGSARRRQREGPPRRRAPAPRRRAPTYKKTPPSTGTTPASYADARRRANAATARRRNSDGTPGATPTGARRRIASPVDGKTHSNPNSPGAGNYGYQNQQKINNNYPGGYQQSSYGYTGPNAHKSKSNVPLMIGAAAGGMVVGGAVMYGASRWSRGGWGWRNQKCVYDSSIHGCCSEGIGGLITGLGECGDCQRNGYRIKYGYPNGASCKRCRNQYGNRCSSFLRRNANRDDVMATGFIPADYANPITLTIYKIDGMDFADKTGLCPPAGWNGTTNTPPWTPVDPFPDMYLTISAMMELEESLAMDRYDQANQAAVHGLPFVLLALLALNLRRLW